MFFSRRSAEWFISNKSHVPSGDVAAYTAYGTARRKKFCARIATGDYDAVIIGHSQFEKIPISMERQERLLQEQIDDIANGIQEVQNSGGERFTVKQLERTKKGLEARLVKLQAIIVRMML